VDPKRKLETDVDLTRFSRQVRQERQGLQQGQNLKFSIVDGNDFEQSSRASLNAFALGVLCVLARKVLCAQG
jgi:hypothetical protein